MEKDQETQKVRVRVIVRGRVQGVFFRYSAQEMANRLGVFGWVKNRWDGAVEALFEGGQDRVKEMIDWCHKGPPGAHVQRVDIDWQKYLGEFNGFSITY